MEVDFPRGPGRYIYALVDPRDDRIRYIGKVKGYLNTRLHNHLREARTGTRVNHRLNWIRGLLRQGLRPQIVMLEVVETPERLIKSERDWIACLREIGLDLVNGTDGGEGMENPSPETREKLRRRPQAHWPKEVRLAGNKALKEKWANPDFRAEMIEKIREGRRKGKPRIFSDEDRKTRAEIARKNQAAGIMKIGRTPGFTHSPETRAKMSESIKAAWRRRKGIADADSL